METIGAIGDVEEIENVWIPMSDGCRIAARIWLPRTARSARRCRRSWSTSRTASATSRARRDEPIHGYFAGHGYAAVRVDVRGSGDSDGVLRDEYSWQEQEDALEVIAWIAAQPWCNGAVGMMGISWGGFNALQVAALPAAGAEGDHHALLDRRPLCRRRPLHGRLPAQREHAVGLGPARSTAPIRPIRRSSATAGGRCGASGSTISCRSRRSGCSTSGATTTGSTARSARTTAPSSCAVYAIGGWADGYSNAIPRLLAGLHVPEEGADRAVGAPLSARRRARPGDRLPAGGGALVGPVAARRRHRHHGRAAAARLDAGERGAAALLRRAAGPLGRGGGVALAAHRGAHAASRSGRPGSRQPADRGGARRSPRRRPPGAPPASGAASAARARCRPTSARTTAARSPSTARRWPSAWRSWARRWSSSRSRPTGRSRLLASRLARAAGRRLEPS